MAEDARTGQGERRQDGVRIAASDDRGLNAPTLAMRRTGHVGIVGRDGSGRRACFGPMSSTQP